MDPEANMAEQLAIANRILTILDQETNDAGVLAVFRMEDIVDKANRLAELVIALAEWNSSKTV